MAKSKGVYSEQELKDRCVGSFINKEIAFDGATKWSVKRKTYEQENVYKAYTMVRDSFRVFFMDYEGARSGVVDHMLCDKCAQKMVDAFLLRRCRGETPDLPRPLVAANIKLKEEDSGIELYDPSLFADKPNISENEKLKWIFENMQVANVLPQDAPSAGAYAMLMQYRSNPQQRADFYKTTYTKLLTKEDAEKSGKLEDDGKETIELIDRLIKALPESEEK